MRCREHHGYVAIDGQLAVAWEPALLLFDLYRWVGVTVRALPAGIPQA